MTSLDPKGLQAAFRWFANGPDQVPVHEMVSGIVTAYLSASTTPSGEVEVLEPVAWRSKVDLADEWDFTAIDPHCDTTDFAAVEPLIRLSEASTALASMKREVERLTSERDAARSAVDAFSDICVELGVERDNEAGLVAASDLKARIQVLEEALKPSGETKAAYIGEFSFTVTGFELDDDGEPFEAQQTVTVPWTTVKEIMAAISDRAASQALGRK